MQANSFQFAQLIYKESKFWIALGTAFWYGFKGFNWIKAIRTNDLHHIQLGVNELKDGLNKQTESIVNELKELRNDFRSFYVRPSRRSPRKRN